MTERVTLYRKNGETVQDIPASVQRDKIFINSADIPVEEGDVFEYITPADTKQRFIATDVQYFNDHMLGGLRRMNMIKKRMT